MNSLAYTIFGGFAMALADSVPGVSGGTIAFLLGFLTGLSARSTRLSTAHGVRKSARFSIF